MRFTILSTSFLEVKEENKNIGEKNKESPANFFSRREEIRKCGILIVSPLRSDGAALASGIFEMMTTTKKTVHHALYTNR